MRVLVTGATGFTGRHLINVLHARGDEPFALLADLRDAGGVAAEIASLRPNAVIRLAAMAFVATSDFDPFYAINQVGSFHLLDALARHVPGIPVLLASSAQVYFSGSSGLLDEQAETKPSNHYGLSKFAMELGADFWRDKLRLIIARPFNYTGVGQDKKYLIPKIVDHFVRGEASIELGNIDVRRDFGDVRSVSHAYVELINTPDARGTFNVSTGMLTSVREIVAMLADITDNAISISINPDFVRPNDIAVLGGDNTKLRTALPDWTPIPLAATLRWMLEQQTD